MSKQEVVKQVEEKQIVYICDACGKRQPHYNGFKSCEICDKDLCSRCGVLDPEDWSDYPCKWCDDCWKVGEVFRDEISKARLLFEKYEQAQMEQWRKIALIKK